MNPEFRHSAIRRFVVRHFGIVPVQEVEDWQPSLTINLPTGATFLSIPHGEQRRTVVLATSPDAAQMARLRATLLHLSGVPRAFWCENATIEPIHIEEECCHWCGLFPKTTIPASATGDYDRCSECNGN